MIFGREPVVVMAVLQCGIALGVSFGLGWSVEQVGAVTAFSAAVLGLIARQTVTPNASVALRVDGSK